MVDLKKSQEHMGAPGHYGLEYCQRMDGEW
jgi:hypothetical protein